MFQRRKHTAVVGIVLAFGCDASEEMRLVEVPTPPAPLTVVHTLESGETLAGVFARYGLSANNIVKIVEAIRKFESPRRMRPGMEVQFAARPQEPPIRIMLQLDRDRTLFLLPELNGPETWNARLDSVHVIRDTILLAGLIDSNPYDSELSGDVDKLAPGEFHEIIFRLSQIFGWQIDFRRDLRKHDAYRLVVAREVRPDGSIRSAMVLAAEFRNNGRNLSAIRFQSADTARVEYYDEAGEALRGEFLLAPLDLARMTSGFNLRRLHPVLRQTRPHLGVDYGAARGVEVRATGSGRVIRAGSWGSYGTLVEIRHANELRTRYAHLSGIARGVRSGVRIEQGHVIGYVGSTGLSTGPHLHYEFLQNGRQVNPARMDWPKADPVPDELRELFIATSDFALLRLGALSMPAARTVPVARPAQIYKAAPR
jgi:murein DD-endopeptidase MepM/ murein hydrolase activator NlpD